MGGIINKEKRLSNSSAHGGSARSMNSRMLEESFMQSARSKPDLNNACEYISGCSAGQTDDDCCCGLEEKKEIRHVIEKLRIANTPECREKQLILLNQMMYKTEKFRICLIANEAWVPILASLACSSLSVREAAIAAILSLSESEQSHSKLVQGGAITWLCNVLADTSNDSNTANLKALATLHRLSMQRSHQVRLLQEGVLELALDAILSPLRPLDHKIAAARLLPQLCDAEAGGEAVAALRARNAAARILPLAAFYNEAVQLSALAALAALAAPPDLLPHLLHDLDALLPLKHMLGSAAGAPLLATLRALAALAAHAAAQELMGERGFVPRVLKHCQSESAPAALAATHLLALLAQSPTNCPRIVTYGGFAPLMRNAHAADAPPELRAASLAIIESLVHLHDATRIEAAVRSAVGRLRRAAAEPAPGPDIGEMG